MMVTITPKRIVVRCAQCTTPILELQDAVVVIKARHLGVHHTTAIPLIQLLKQLGFHLTTE